jgi:hypothetical protein
MEVFVDLIRRNSDILQRYEKRFLGRYETSLLMPWDDRGIIAAKRQPNEHQDEQSHTSIECENRQPRKLFHSAFGVSAGRVLVPIVPRIHHHHSWR